MFLLRNNSHNGLAYRRTQERASSEFRTKILRVPRSSSKMEPLYAKQLWKQAPGIEFSQIKYFEHDAIAEIYP